MTIAVVALAVALATVVGVLAALRRPWDKREDVAVAIEALNARLDAMMRELADAREQLLQAGRRNRFLGELASSIDLDEVLARTLEAAGALPGVDAAVVRVTGPEGTPVVAGLGVPAEEAEEQAVVGPPDGRAVRSVSASYRYAPDELAAAGDDLLQAAVSVPIPGTISQLGVLTVYTKAAGRTFGEDDVRELEELALRAGPAIENASRFKEARQLADLDALTGLHNRRYFHETLAREVARAHRYQRELALVVLDLDGFKAINDRIGHLSGDSVLAQAAERVRAVVRSADIACRIGGDEFAIILPESSLADSRELCRRIQEAVSFEPVGQAGHLSLSAGIAELTAKDDALSFFTRADEALYQAKEAGRGGVVASAT